MKDDPPPPAQPASDETVARWESELADDYTAEKLLQEVSYDEARSIIVRLRAEMAKSAEQATSFPPPLLEALDAWIAQRPEMITRPQAIRLLTQAAIDAGIGVKRQRPD